MAKGTKEAFNAGVAAGRENRAPSCYPTLYGPGVDKALQAAFIRGYVTGQKTAKAEQEKRN